MVRAERFAALLFFALAVVALHIMGVVDRSIAIGAADGVAVWRFYVIVGPVTRCAKRNDNRLRRMCSCRLTRNRTELIAKLETAEDEGKRESKLPIRGVQNKNLGDCCR